MCDVLVIGGGVVGCAILRELSRYNIKTILLEKSDDVASGTTKANSAIVHAGYDAEPKSLMARLNVRGNFLYANLCAELDVPLMRIGSMVLAWSDNDLRHLQLLQKRGKLNGVPNMSLLKGEQARELEPNIDKGVIAALYAPTGGITCPYELTLALAQNAITNGAEVYTDSEVISITKSASVFTVSTLDKGFKTSYVVNASGLGAAALSAMAGAEELNITYRKGEYLLLDKAVGDTVRHVVFTTPTASGKGVLVTPTVDGNILLGPTATNVQKATDVKTTQEGIKEIVSSARRMVPSVALNKVITQFAGIRAIGQQNDFIVEESSKLKGFIQVAGICSPGLTAAPAIAEYVIDILKASGENLIQKTDFNPIRRSIQRITDMSAEELSGAISENDDYAKIVCRCERITEAQIRAALRAPLPPKTLDALKRRTRAGMGRCQGGFCTPRVLEIMSEELGIPMTSIRKNIPGSELLCGKLREVE